MRNRCCYWFGCLLVVALLVSGAALPVGARPVGDRQNVDLEVAALQRVTELELTPDQLRQLQALAVGTAAKAPASSRESGEYAIALVALRDALISGDEEKISDAQEKVDAFRDSEEEESESSPATSATDLPITDAAREQAPAALKLLTSSQVAAYLGQKADDVPDATQTLMDALDRCRGGADADFASLREEAAAQAAMLVAGIEKASANPIEKKVAALLNQAHAMSEADFSAKRGDLNTSAREIVQSSDPIDSLRHWMQREMADLLSNPTLLPAIEAKLK